MILVERPVHGRDLALSKRVVESIVQSRGIDSHAAGGIAIDDQLGLQSFILLVRVLVAQFRQASQFVQQTWRPVIQVVEICTLQSVLVLRIAEAPANGEILGGLQDQRRARHDGQLAAKTIDHIVGGDQRAALPEMLRPAGAALFQRLQHHKEPPLVQRCVSAGKSDYGINRRIFHHDVDVALHLVAHGLERNILCRHHRAHDASGILLGEKTFGNFDVKEHAEARHQDGHHQGYRLVVQHHGQRMAIGRQELVENPFAPTIEEVASFVLGRSQELGAHGGGGGQGNHQRNPDRDAQGHRELAEQPSHDAAHHQQGNKHGHQRHTHRDDRKPNLGGSLERRLNRVHAVLDIACNILQHHDRVIDHEAGGNSQRHQRKIVEAVAQQVHPAEGSHQ